MFCSLNGYKFCSLFGRMAQHSSSKFAINESSVQVVNEWALLLNNCPIKFDGCWSPNLKGTSEWAEIRFLCWSTNLPTLQSCSHTRLVGVWSEFAYRTMLGMFSKWNQEIRGAYRNTANTNSIKVICVNATHWIERDDRSVKVNIRLRSNETQTRWTFRKHPKSWKLKIKS